MPGRSPLTRRNSTTITGQFNSVREDGVARVFRSRAEFLNLSMLDVDPDVDAFYTDPEPFALPFGRVYKPDVLVIFRDDRAPTYQAVMSLADFRDDPDFKGRLGAIFDECDRRQSTFEIVTEACWLDPIRRSIATSMRHAVRRAKRLEMDVVCSVLQGGALSIEEIARATSLSHQARFAALALCASGKASMRRDRPIGPSTLIWLV